LTVLLSVSPALTLQNLLVRYTIPIQFSKITASFHGSEANYDYTDLISFVNHFFRYISDSTFVKRMIDQFRKERLLKERLIMPEKSSLSIPESRKAARPVNVSVNLSWAWAGSVPQTRGPIAT
jgi:hypothetical protein